MLKILPIMLLSIAQKLLKNQAYYAQKLCFQNQDYARELTVLLEYISVS